MIVMVTAVTDNYVMPVTVLSHFSFTELFNLHNNDMREEVSNCYYSGRKDQRG